MYDLLRSFVVICIIIINEIGFIQFQLTWADLYFTAILDYLTYMVKVDLLEKHPNLQRLVNAVNNLEPIKAWLEKRPQTDV